MKLNEAIEMLDAVIPPPNHSTVDLAHLQIAQAWQTVKETLHLQQTKDKGCYWCKMQTDEFGDQHMTASEIKVISQDRFGKRELPRKFCSVCGRNLEGDT